MLALRGKVDLGVSLGVDERGVTVADFELGSCAGRAGIRRDDVIVAVGSARVIEVVQSYVGRGGVLNLFGGLKKGEDVVGFDTGIIHYKEINVTGSSGGAPSDILRILELMVAGEIDAGNHITRIGDLEQSKKGLWTELNSQGQTIANMDGKLDTLLNLSVKKPE